MKCVLHLKIINTDYFANSEKRKPIFINFLSLSFDIIRILY